MGLYRLSGELVKSELALDAFADRSNDPSRPTIEVTLAPAREGPAFEAGRVVNTIEIEGAPFLTVARSDGAMCMRLHGCGDFLIEASLARVECVPVAGCDDETLAQMLVDRVLPHLLASRGELVIHASMVAIEGNGVAFVGDPGSGKSTLAAALCPPAELVCDDCAVLRLEGSSVIAEPSYPFARLCKDAVLALEGDAMRVARAASRTLKWRAHRPAASGPRRLDTLYTLARHDGPIRIEPLTSRDALVELARHLYRLDPTDRGALRGELGRLERLVGSARVVQLCYPHRFDRLDALRQSILEDHHA